MEKVKLNAQERICTAVTLLCKNHTTGLSNNEIAKLLDVSDVTAHRDLAVLGKNGWIERDNTGRFRMSPVFGRFAGQIMKSYRTAKLQLQADEERFSSAMQ